MHLTALKHLAQELVRHAPDRRFIIFGSTSVFASHPEITSTVETYEQTLDADFVPEPIDEGTWRDLRNALGKESRFFEANGYFADINGPRAFECFPADFRERLVPLEGVDGVWAIEPNDRAVAKLIAGREKDIRLLSILLAHGYLNASIIDARLWRMDMDDKLRVRVDLTLKATLAAAGSLGYKQAPAPSPHD
jgi:hypothetical protein